MTETDPMRVTFVCPIFPRQPSGGPRVIYEYANHLVHQGHRVTVAHQQLRPAWDRPFEQARELARQRWQNLRGGGWTNRIRWTSIDPRVRMTLVDRLAPESLPDSDIVVATYWETARLLPRLGPRHGQGVHLVQDYEVWEG